MNSLFARITNRTLCESSYTKSIDQLLRSPLFRTSSAGAHRSVAENWQPGVGPDDDDIFPTKKELRAMPNVLKQEFKKWIAENKELAKVDPVHDYRIGEIEKVFTFSTDEDLAKWSVTSDVEAGFGYSKCSLTRSSNGHALFSGNISTAIKQDGKSYRSGFCSIRSPRVWKSFGRKGTYDWTQYTHLVMRVRGDGRSYVVNLATDGHFDLFWHDMYSFFLFTRGGPYWQIAKIPFSKFIFGHKGNIQDVQPPLVQDDITCLGLTLQDDIDGPFQLEIDYIGLEISGRHTEEKAYESYYHDNKFFYVEK